MADTNLYNVLNGLHQTDKNMWGKLSGVQDRLSGLISGAFTSGNIAVGIGDKLSASQFSISNTTDSTLFTAENANLTLGTTIANAAAVKDYVDDSIKALSSEQGAALTGVTVSGAVKKLDGNKTVEIGIDVDGTTISQEGNVLKSVLKIVKEETPTGKLSAYAAVYRLADSTGTAIEGSDPICVLKDQFMKSASYDSTTEELVFVIATNDNGTESTAEVRIPVGDLVHEYIGSDAIAVASAVNGSTVISLKLDDSTEDFLTVGAGGLKLSGVQDAINTKGDAISSYLWDSTSGEIYKALNGYTGENAVSTKFKAIDDKLSAAGLDAKFAPDQIIIGSSTSGLAASVYSFGTTDANGADFGAANKLATEVGAKGYVNTKVSTAVSGVTTADQFVFGAGAGAVKTTGMTVLSASQYTTEDALVDTQIPTAAAVKAYVSDGLSALLEQVNELNAKINPGA